MGMMVSGDGLGWGQIPVPVQLSRRSATLLLPRTSVLWRLGGKPALCALAVGASRCAETAVWNLLFFGDFWTLIVQIWKIPCSVREIIALRLRSGANADHVRFTVDFERTLKDISKTSTPCSGKVWATSHFLQTFNINTGTWSTIGMPS